MRRPSSSGDRHFRYMVQLRPLAFFHSGMAGRHRGSARLLPHGRAHHGSGHHFFLGGAHDHDGTEVHGGGPFQASAHQWHRARRRAQEDEQDSRERDRPPGASGRVRSRRGAIHPLIDGGSRDGHSLFQRSDEGVPGLCQQGLECGPVCSG